MKVENFKKEINNAWKKYFPDSLIIIQTSTFYKSISISCYIAKNTKECINGYLENDMLSFRFIITNGNNQELDSVDDNYNLDIIKLEPLSNNYLIKPIFNKYNCYDTIKIKVRKTTGTPEKIIQKLDDYFSSLKTSLKESIQKDIIHNNHLALLRTKI